MELKIIKSYFKEKYDFNKSRMRKYENYLLKNTIKVNRKSQTKCFKCMKAFLVK